MKKVNYNIFCILEGKNLKVAKPIHTFISENTEQAKLYLTGYQLDDYKFYNYYLYKIAEIDKNTLEIIPKKVFITGGYENKYREKEIDLIKKAKKEEKITKQIEILFQGVKI